MWMCAVALIAATASASSAQAESFPKPTALAPNVAFWKRVYIEWSINDIALHDMDDLSIVYRVVPVPARGEKNKEGLGRKDVVAKATRELESALRELARKNPKDGSKLDGVEKVVFENLKNVSRPDKYSRLAQIRAQNGLRERFVQGYQNSGLFEQTIYTELRKGGLPDELIGIAFVESLFYMGAKSKVGAAGIWQFMTYTGREYVHLNDVIDERYDPILATEAAVKYLRQSKKELKEWPLIVTSYNYGRGGTKGLVNGAGTTDFNTILAVSKNKRFGFAARNYYASFLAVNEILKEQHPNLKGVQRKPAWSYDVVRVPFPVLAPQLYATGVVDQKSFEALNPGLTDAATAGKVVLPTGISVRVPTGKGKDLATKVAALGKADRNKAMAMARGTHKATGKQTIEQIAKTYGMEAQTLASTLGVEASHKPPKGTAISVPSRMAAYTLLPEARGTAIPATSSVVPDVMVASAVQAPVEAAAVVAAATPVVAPPTPIALAAPVVEPTPVVVAEVAKSGVTVGKVTVIRDEKVVPGVDLVSGAASFALPAVDAVAGDPGKDAPWPLDLPAPMVPVEEARPTS